MLSAPGVQASDTDVLVNRKSTRLNSSHGYISYAVFCLKKKKKSKNLTILQKKLSSRIKLPINNELRMVYCYCVKIYQQNHFVTSFLRYHCHTIMIFSQI